MYCIFATDIYFSSTHRNYDNLNILYTRVDRYRNHIFMDIPSSRGMCPHIDQPPTICMQGAIMHHIIFLVGEATKGPQAALNTCGYR
jgi:hypothetical protein